MLKNRWNYAHLFLLLLLAIPSVISLLSSDPELALSWLAFIFSAEVTFIGPCFRKPRLRADVNIQYSPPTKSEEKDGVKGSHFVRLKVTNAGISQAKNCVGRLIEVRTRSEKFDNFDPMTLYWARQKITVTEPDKQNDPNTFEPIDIQGYGDFYCLDIAQASDDKKEFVFSAVIPPRQRFVTHPEHPNADQGKLETSKGPYYLRIGIYSDIAYIEPQWFELKLDNAKKPLFEKLSKKEADRLGLNKKP